MIPLLAHHTETLSASDYPILVLMFTVGAWLGWDLLGRLLARPASNDPHVD